MPGGGQLPIQAATEALRKATRTASTLNTPDAAVVAWLYALASDVSRVFDCEEENNEAD